MIKPAVGDFHHRVIPAHIPFEDASKCEFDKVFVLLFVARGRTYPTQSVPMPSRHSGSDALSVMRGKHERYSFLALTF